MRRFLAVRLAATLWLALDVGPAWAEGKDSDPVVTGGQGSYQGRLDRLSRGGKRHSHRAEGNGAGTSLRGHKTPPKPHKLSARELAAITVMCREAPGGICTDPKTKATGKPSQAKLIGSLSQVARTLIVKLQLPDPTPRFGPDPSVNEWKMAAVGYPLWLWTDGPRTVSSRVRAYGVTFTLRADWLSTTFDMGDGHRVTCARTLVYPSSTKPGRKSPACGYTYLTSSLPRGNYTVTATTNWRINWSALGQSGSLPGSHAGQWSLPVGELNALVVK